MRATWRRRVFDALSGLLIAERSEVSLADLARRLAAPSAGQTALACCASAIARSSALKWPIPSRPPIPSMKKSAISAPHSRSTLNIPQITSLL